jgi:hypothetical protein
MAIRRASLAVLTAALLLAAPSLPVTEDLAKLQERFDKEKDGEKKVKIMEKLAEAQIARERAASDSNDFKTVGFTFEKYRDNLRAALEALKRKHPNAVKKPTGYKHLEILNQRALREVTDALLVAPEVYKPPLQIVQSDLKKMEDELLFLLFPDRPGEKPLPPKNAPLDEKLAAPDEKKP